MKKINLLFLLLPFVLFSLNAISQATAKTYTINGTIKGVPDGTTVDLLNGNTGTPENSTTVTNGNFILKGTVAYPDFKLITLNKQPKYIQVFLDNSNVQLVANKDSIELANVTGSPSHEDFKRFLSLVKKYEIYFVPNGANDAEGLANAIATLEGFVKNNPGSYVSPIALYKSFQLSENNAKLEELFNGLSANVRETPIGSYISNQIEESKYNQIGQPLQDFSQDDPSGKSIKLSSFKGKYVLVDFWASWCGPCRQENPNIVNLYKKYKNKNFDVFGVSLDKAKQPWLDAIQKDNLTWPHVSDLKGWNNEVAKQFRITSIPQNFLLDPNGIIVAKNLRGEDLERKLEALLK